MCKNISNQVDHIKHSQLSKKSDLVIVTRGRTRGGGKGDQEGRGYTTIKENSGRRVRETGNRWVGIMGENQT